MLTTFDAGDGRTLSYQRRGSGPLVVCVPGGPGMDPQSYFATLAIPGHEQLIFAPRGTGASSPPRELSGYQIAGYIEDLESLREHLDVTTLTLYGNSHGGMTTVAYARAHPDRVDRFVATNPPPRFDDAYQRAAESAAQRYRDAVPDGAARLAAAAEAEVALESQLTPEERAHHFRTLLSRYVAHEGERERAYLDRAAAAPTNWEAVEVMWEEMTSGLDLLDGASTVQVRALIVAGELDNVVPAEATRLIADAFPNARYLEIPGVCHFPEVEASEALAAAVAEFLAE